MSNQPLCLCYYASLRSLSRISLFREDGLWKAQILKMKRVYTLAHGSLKTSINYA